MDRRLFIGAAALGLGLGGPVFAQDAGVAPVGPDDLVLGSPKAPVTVIEYASASCPHCARFNNEVFPAFKAKYIDTGQVYYAFREFLTPPVEFAAAAFLIARCAGKDKYFTVLDGVFQAQAEIYQSGDLHGPMLKIAQAAGLDEKAVDACLADTKAIEALNARMQQYLSRDKVSSTPTFVVNGARLVGEQTLAALDTAIAAAEAKAKAKPQGHPARRRHPHA
ncbi:MAG: thioredoxin domain-containing protein [Caulobacteraceae bacterium]|nr:thioredoxin domain-containing protein [Caulobacteraceae bacterium]